MISNLIKKLKKYSFLHNNYTLVKFFFTGVFFIVCNYMPITTKIKGLNVKSIKIFKFMLWHEGFAYFTGKLYNSDVFIKVDTKLHLLSNDILSYERLTELPEMEDKLVKIIDYSVGDQIEIVLYDFVLGQELTEQAIIQDPNLIVELYDIIVDINTQGIIHRDINLNNFLITNEKVKIIDFTFANSLGETLGFTELRVQTERDRRLLKYLGLGLNPEPFVWNDFYSVCQILKRIMLNHQSKCDENTCKMFSHYINELKCYAEDSNYTYVLSEHSGR